MYVVHLLVGNSAVVLQNVVALAFRGIVFIEFQDFGQLLDHWQQLGKILIGDIVQLGAVVFGNNKTVSLSSGLNVQEGVSVLCLKQLERRDFTLDDFAENARCVERHGIYRSVGNCGGYVRLL